MYFVFSILYLKTSILNKVLFLACLQVLYQIIEILQNIMISIKLLKLLTCNKCFLKLCVLDTCKHKGFQIIHNIQTLVHFQVII
jgi:hypothetical protein